LLPIIWQGSRWALLLLPLPHLVVLQVPLPPMEPLPLEEPPPPLPHLVVLALPLPPMEPPMEPPPLLPPMEPPTMEPPPVLPHHLPKPMEPPPVLPHHLPKPPPMLPHHLPKPFRRSPQLATTCRHLSPLLVAPLLLVKLPWPLVKLPIVQLHERPKLCLST
jgi:hypothetical protein